MDTEALSRLLAREADGELSQAERDELAAALAADGEARELAASWRASNDALDSYVSSLGAPSSATRRRVVDADRPDSRAPEAGRPDNRALHMIPARTALAAAAALVLAVSAGVGIGAAVFSHQGAPDVHVSVDLASLGSLRSALAETRQLMPQRVAWTALCEGQLKLGTAPLPLDADAAYHFATFVVERSDRAAAQVCQLAVLDGEEAAVEWESDGRWTITCVPTSEGADGRVRLSAVLDYRRADGGRGLHVESEPVVAIGERTHLASSRIGRVGFRVYVTVLDGRSPQPDGNATL